MVGLKQNQNPLYSQTLVSRIKSLNNKNNYNRANKLRKCDVEAS